ncbi:DUF6153 family protein [Streptomyces sirii]|uniref:DUF6153 family protein n=1 Tax=Streptomyces sirii TaxID=3127701 RepID=UPI003D36B8BB
MSGQQRRFTAWCGRLLLFSALLFGIVAMHSLGHPAEHRTPQASDTTAMAAAAPAHHHAAEPAAGAPQADRPDPGAHHPTPLGGMNPMSVCLAVLGAGFLVLLLGGAFVRGPADVPATALARLPHALRPIPPPRRRTLLAQLSVLRI